MGCPFIAIFQDRCRQPEGVIPFFRVPRYSCDRDCHRFAPRESAASDGPMLLPSVRIQRSCRFLHLLRFVSPINGRATLRPSELPARPFEQSEESALHPAYALPLKTGFLVSLGMMDCPLVRNTHRKVSKRQCGASMRVVLQALRHRPKISRSIELMVRQHSVVPLSVERVPLQPHSR
jgi:hypothetical protein